MIIIPIWINHEDSDKEVPYKFIIRGSGYTNKNNHIRSWVRSARIFTRARILLKADQGDQGSNWSGEKISDALDVTVQTIERIRKQFVEEGFAAVLSRRQYRQKVFRKKIDGNVEAHLINQLKPSAMLMV